MCASKKLFGVLTLCLLILQAYNATASYQDPLSSSEASLAEDLVLKQLDHAKKKTAQVNSPYEILLVERDRSNDKHSTNRLINVFVYDYTNDQTLIYQIDSKDNKVVASTAKKNTQLPLTSNELKRSLELIAADTEVSALISHEYQKITQKALNSLDELELRAFVFTADTLPEQLNKASQLCGQQRCAQVLIYTNDATVVEMSPIVNLSSGIITQVIGF